MRPTPIGALRRRVTLQAPVEAPDLAGGVARGWMPVATLWAAIEPLASAPVLLGDAPTSRTTHRVVLRWRAGVAAGMRLAEGARLFSIRSALDPDERRRRLVLLVEEEGA
jgi:SPP1 family predicted phage head-tail adaptor